MRILICAAFLVLLLNPAKGSVTTVDLIFGIIKGAIETLQEKPINDPTGCYMQWHGLHRAVNDLIDAIINTGNIAIIISNVLDILKNMIYIKDTCVVHDIDDDIQHFTKHPGDFIGRLIWNYKLTISFFRDFINGFSTKDFQQVGRGFGAIIYVIFDGKIL